MWLDESSNITPLERKKLTEERQRRKTSRPPVRVALLVPQEGVTPVQFKRYQEILPSMGATEVHFPELPSKVYYVLKQLEGVELFKYGTARSYDGACAEAIKHSTVALAFPKTAQPWEVVRYAKHRSLPVRVILPNGQEA